MTKIMLHRHKNNDFEGSLHFVTTVTRERGNWFVHEEMCQEVLRIFEWWRVKFEVSCLGYVLMPDHLHGLLLQEKEGAVSKLMRSFKCYTSRYVKPINYPSATLWRDYFDDVPVPGPNAAFTKLNYLHQNPIRKGLAGRETEYPWSSIHDYNESRRAIVTVSRIDAIAGLETHNGE
jgi:putative transposase